MLTTFKARKGEIYFRVNPDEGLQTFLSESSMS